jgi:hypothetical protein
VEDSDMKVDAEHIEVEEHEKYGVIVIEEE